VAFDSPYLGNALSYSPKHVPKINWYIPAPMETDEQEDDSIVWTVVEASSRQRHPKLTSSSGYSYNVKRRNKARSSGSAAIVSIELVSCAEPR